MNTREIAEECYQSIDMAAPSRAIIDAFEDILDRHLEGMVNPTKAMIEADLAECRGALELSVLAIDDWLHTYADDLCNENDVARSRSRIQSRGGTLAYIAEVQQANRKALGIKPKTWGEVLEARKP